LSERDVEKICVIPAKEGTGIFQSIQEAPKFFASVRQEMKLVSRPSWQEVRSTTLVVIVFAILFLLYFYVLDKVFSPLRDWLFLS
jgi:preprotein translocase SecE subunit